MITQNHWELIIWPYPKNAQHTLCIFYALYCRTWDIRYATYEYIMGNNCDKIIFQMQKIIGIKYNLARPSLCGYYVFIMKFTQRCRSPKKSNMISGNILWNSTSNICDLSNIAWLALVKYFIQMVFHKLCMEPMTRMLLNKWSLYGPKHSEIAELGAFT